MMASPMSQFPTEITDIAYLSGILILPKQEYNGQADSWWLRSPHTGHTDVAYVVRSSGDVGYSDYWHVTGSYGALRTPASTTLRVGCGRVMTWTVTAAVWTVPTGYLNSSKSYFLLEE